VPLAEVSYADVVEWISGIDLAPASVRYVHRVFSLILALAVQDGRLARNLANGLERRVRLLLVLMTVGKLVLSSGILIDISRFDHAWFTDDAGAATLDALECKNLAKNGWNALAASTALNNGWALVTNETRRLPNRARKQGIEVLTTDDLLREIEHTP
jgi:hypothetical protein